VSFVYFGESYGKRKGCWGVILAAFAVIAVVFTLAIWVPTFDAYSLLAIKIVVWLLVVGVSAIAIWLGWVMVSTKPVIPEEKPMETSVQQSGEQEKSNQ